MSTASVQLPSTWEAGDVAGFNYGVTDIAAFKVVKVDATNTVTNSVSSLATGVGIALPATGGDPDLCWGVTLETIKAGQSGRVRTRGIAPVIADGAVTGGTIIDASPTVAGAVKAHTAAKKSFGQALITVADTETTLVDIGWGAAQNA